MPAWTISINLGPNEEGQKRHEAYRKCATKKDMSLNEWVKTELDLAAKIKFVKE